MSADEVLDSIDRAVRDWEVSDDAMRWTPDRADFRSLPSPSAADTSRFLEAFSRLAENVGQSMRAFGAAIKQAWEPTRRGVHILHARRYPKDHIRCWSCNPCANPRPLKVNGADYRRRRRNRTRRRL